MKKFDVVIYEIGTRKVCSIAGKDLPEEGGFHTVDKRIETVMPRLNDSYNVMAVDAGAVKVGDVLPEDTGR